MARLRVPPGCGSSALGVNSLGVKAVASRWGNDTAGHLGCVSESYSGHSNSRDCLTQGDLKLCLDPCLNPFQLYFPHNCASFSLLLCLWVASRLLRAASLHRITFCSSPPWKLSFLCPSPPSVWPLLEMTFEIANSQRRGVAALKNPLNHNISLQIWLELRGSGTEVSSPGPHMGSTTAFYTQQSFSSEPHRAPAAFWPFPTPSIQINVINCQNSVWESMFW